MSDQLTDRWMTDEERVIFTYGTYIAALAFITIVHHIKEGKEAWIPSRIEAWKSTVFNTLLGCTSVSIVSYFHGFGRLHDSFDGYGITLMRFITFVLMEDALFYWSHRGLHSNQRIYKWIHAYHHKSHKDVTLVNGMQVTPYEFFLSLFLPGAIPLLLVPMNRAVWEGICWISVFGVICDHGLDIFPKLMIPFPLNGTEHHKRHHERVRGNYSGPLSIWDYICDTHFKGPYFHKSKDNEENKDFATIANLADVTPSKSN